MELKILDIKGNNTNRKVKIDDSIFTTVNFSYDHSVYLEIKRFLSAQRQGTHKSKERGELSGSTRKLHRQKGTGGSRKGDIKNPIFRGGGRVFGPRPKHYFFKLNKLTKKLVRRYIIGYKLKTNKIKIIEDIELETPKTKFILKILNLLQLKNKKLLMITGKSNKNLYLSSRNLKNFKLLNIDELNSYSLLDSSYIIFSENSMSKIHDFLKFSK
ncbi:50S ribosomal protein L4 [Blattabacterium cuenoti]|uniref:50S ribosomal protein L4 n=1 Tax=Blattabacterium cuenoti TaxID=1653831 RepID=UPI00163D0892|nr:50S ribosomal protein L4 [Blattabacterium cuenoti]